MDLAFRHATRYWAFWVGLALRLVLIAVVVPRTQETWFLPFFDHFVSHPGLDPWSSFLAAGGTPEAFPYGPIMAWAFWPLASLGWLITVPFGLEAIGVAAGLKLTLLVADAAVLFTLIYLNRQVPRLVVLFYWLSPIILYVTYWHGQLDIVPVALLVGALVFLYKLRIRLAGVFLGAAVAAKLSMLLALPFIAIYLYQSKRIRRALPNFAAAFGVMVALGVILPLGSAGYQEMVMGTPEMKKLFQLALTQSDYIEVYLVPIVFLFLVYATWRLHRSNFQLVFNMAGLGFLLLVLLTPAPPGWYVWILPFLVAFQLHTNLTGRFLVLAFSFLAVAWLATISWNAAIPLLGIDWGYTGLGADQARLLSIANTGIIGLGAIITFLMYQLGVRKNDYFRLSRAPLGIGISGDSGTGKDTLGSALESLFGRTAVTHLYGDGYHRWARGAPMWRTLTHLDPRANDLYRLTSDAKALVEGRNTTVQRYNHKTGRFDRPRLLRSNDVVLVTGLHTLLPPNLVEKLDVRIFLDTDDELKTYWKLRRDVYQRGRARSQVLSQIDQRRPDRVKYIDPQKENADLIFALEPVNRAHLREDDPPSYLPLKLNAVIRNGFYHERLNKVLIALCGIQLDSQISANGRDVELSIQGDVWREDIALAARALVPHLEELLDSEPDWAADMLGVMQLIALVQASERLKERDGG